MMLDIIYVLSVFMIILITLSYFQGQSRYKANKKLEDRINKLK